MEQAGQILMEWSLNNNEYETSFILYNLGIGIPAKFLYKIPEKNSFQSTEEFLNSDTIKYSTDIYINKLSILFKTSKYTRLEEWNNLYGYRLI